MLLKSKKGIALNQAFGAVLTLVIVGVLIIIGITLFASMITSAFTGLSGTAETVTGNSLTPVASVSNSSVCGFSDCAVVTITNSTGGAITSPNFTASSAGVITNLSVMVDATVSPWIVNYSHTSGGAACNAAQDMIIQFGTYPALLGLVGTIIFLGLVIGVLVSSFVFGGKNNGL